jgi:hypothetical protein
VGLGALEFIIVIIRAVPVWGAVLVGFGGWTHPFLSFEDHVHGAGLVVLALGCVAVSASLLRMSNDEFDLPPLSP